MGVFNIYFYTGCHYTSGTVFEIVRSMILISRYVLVLLGKSHVLGIFSRSAGRLWLSTGWCKVGVLNRVCNALTPEHKK